MSPEWWEGRVPLRQGSWWVVPGTPADVEQMSFAQGKVLSLTAQDSIGTLHTEASNIPS